MKNIYIKLIAFATAVLLLSACDDMDDLNTNPDTPTTVTPEMLCTGVILKINKFSGDVKAYVATSALPKYVGYATEGAMAEQYNNIGRGSFDMFTAFPNIEKMEEYAEGDIYENSYFGVGAFARAFVLYRLTMEMGDIPCTDAGKGADGLYKPSYDTQLSVFQTIIDLLTQAEAYFADATNDFPGDPIYNGDNAKWRKACNSFLMKVYMSLSEKTGESSLSVASGFASAASRPIFESNDDNYQLVYADETNRYHPFYSTNTNFAMGTVISSFVVDMLKNLNDYRLFYYAEPYENSGNDGYSPTDFNAYRGLDVTLDYTTLNALHNTGNYSRMNFRYHELRDSEPLVYFGYADQCLMIAEAIERGWMSGNSADYYERGVRAALEFTMATNSSYANGSPITETYIDNYFTGDAAYKSTTDDRLKQIWTQRYLMNFMQDGKAQYFEYRRTGYPELPFDTSTNLNPNAPNQLPLRWMYPSSEATTNRDNLEEALARQFNGTDENNDVMWLLK
ncbi:MAG: SusD/RagB family nutrient-binding outer membrane lipoprotein [Alistipes sp.]|nr:SusD/RagB family nutrient-binding outer membrane lipoprotein [Alistipes sp.]